MMKNIFKLAAAASLSLCLLLAACAGSNTSMNSSAAAQTGSSSQAAVSSSAAAQKNSDGYTVIDTAAAKKMIDAGGVIIVDVRTDSEYASAHIPDAINIPVESIGTEKPSQLPDTGAVILVYCRTGIRAAAASKKLAAMGYTDIYDMGGIVDWQYETTSSK